MTSQNKLVIYNKLFIFIKLLYKTVHGMPKEYKFTLGSDIIVLAWSCIDLAIEANSRSNNEKIVILKKLSIEFDKLKLRLRMAQEIKIISVKQFAHWNENYISQIGAMIGGWIKWSK